jgi:tetratricopeptide (TPR) repeat protein
VRSIPFSQNRKFVGRKEELESLERKLFTDRDCGKMVIFGLGGIGKTQVVLQFAYLVLEKYPDVSVFWVPAVSFETFEQAYREMARLLEITDATGGNEDVKELVRRHLSAEKASKWVLVVDNADDMDILYGSGGKDGILQYLPESESGSTVFTTRDAYVAQSLAGSDVIEVAKMAHPEALHVLRNALIRKDVLRDEATTTRLMTELDYLPLATTQAAAYMNCNKVSLLGYLDLLKGTEQDIVQIMSTEIRDHTRYEQASSAVAKTWLVSFEQVVQRDADAADLLRYISCIEWKSIPQSILPSIKPAARMMSAIGTLCSYSFITPRDDEGKYDMHRLVHVAARIWLRQEGLMVETQRRALKHLSDIFPSDDYDNRKIWREYIPHVTRMRVTRECESAEVRGELCLKVGRCLEIDGRIRDAVDWLEESRDLRSSLPESHPDRLHSQHALAIAYQAHGQVKEAVQLLEQVVAMNNQLEEDYPDRLASQHSLAIAYQANGQVVEAVRLLEHVVAIREQVLLEDHPHRLASQHTLARSYTANGQTKKAIRLLEHVVAVRERILVEDHPHRLVSQAVLASAYQANRQAYKAVRLLEHVATINQRMLAEEHPDRLASQHSLGIAYQVNGQVKEAVQLLEHVVAIREQVLAKDHPHRLVSQAALASADLAYRRTGWLGPRARVNTEEHGVDTTKAVASIAGFEQAMAQQPGQSRSSVCLGPSQMESRKERGHGTIREWWRKWKYEK